VIVEDHKNPSLLFVGTEMAVYVSIDGGKKWIRMKNNMPTNAVHDLLIHPRENDLVVGTHGRGIFITDITPLQEMSDEVLSKEIYLFDIKPAVPWTIRRGMSFSGHRHFTADNEQYGVAINYYLKQDVNKKVSIRITDAYGENVVSLNGKQKAGINTVHWQLRRPYTKEEKVTSHFERYRMSQGKLMPPGDYIAVLKIGETEIKKKFKILSVPEFD
jgi:hypothetical protein